MRLPEMNDPFLLYTQQDITSSLQLLDRQFRNIINIGYDKNYLTPILQLNYPEAKIDFLRIIDRQENLLLNQQFDLITSSMLIHLVDDIQKLLKNICECMEPTGIFCANFIGGSSLKSLRKTLIESEIKSEFQHSPYILPFINFDHVTQLLQQAGFIEIVANYERIDLEYSSALALLTKLYNSKESNSLARTTNHKISEEMKHILENNYKPFYDSVYLINFIASKSKNSIKVRQQD